MVGDNYHGGKGFAKKLKAEQLLVYRAKFGK